MIVGRRYFFVFFLAFATALFALGPVVYAHVGDNIILSQDISRKYRQSLNLDFERLEKFDQTSTVEQQTLDLLGLDDPYMLFSEWLEERVSYIIEYFPLTEIDYRIQRHEIQKTRRENLPQNFLMPDRSAQGTHMQNLGTHLFLLGQFFGFTYEIEITTGSFRGSFREQVMIKSPRAGVIQLGPSIFSNRGMLDPRDRDSAANSYDRLATLFHEARHSDGEGLNTGHLHVACPEGHDYAERVACDDIADGAYMVGARMLHEFIANCRDCSESDLARLELRYLDSLGRVLSLE